MKKRVLCLILTLALCLGMLPQAMAASLSTDDKTVTIVVNTKLDTSYANGSFSSESEAVAPSAASKAPVASTDDMAGITGYRVDAQTGRILYQRAAELPVEELPHESEETPYLSQEPAKAAYTVDSTKTIIEYSNKTEIVRTMQCLYVGEHCTVWCDTGKDKADVRLSAENAALIGQEFDRQQQKAIDSFGSWYDRDGDGKLAIFCYDMASSYEDPNALTKGFTSGYFYCYDLCGTSGSLGPYNYGISDTRKSINMNVDCIHLDTYPSMGAYVDDETFDPFGNIPGCYSTLMHEFQHMINYSYLVDETTKYAAMEDYLNEAFSMAAEHMLCGPASTADRIDYFNTPTENAPYIPGSPLTYWDKYDTYSYALSNYSNSYLFGQYVRTRYAQQTGTDGNTIFKETLETRDANKGGDTLEMLASVLHTTPRELVLDFWTAVYRKDPSGKYGFAGEKWADAIQPQFSAASSKSGIYSGGAKFYHGSLTATNQNNVELLTVRSVSEEKKIRTLMMLTRYVSGISNSSDTTAMDINGDKKVNAQDITAMARLLK